MEPVRYVGAMIPRLLADAKRDRRVRKGWAAKPGRTDGRAGTVAVQLRLLANDEQTGEWLTSLFRILQFYVHREGRVGTTWPELALAHERRMLFGGDEAAADPLLVRADIQMVLRVAEEIAGSSWVQQHLLEPLFAGQVPSALPDEVEYQGLSLEDRAVARWFSDQYTRRRRAGASRQDAFREAALAIGGNPGHVDHVMLADLDALAQELSAPALGQAGGVARPDTAVA